MLMQQTGLAIGFGALVGGYVGSKEGNRVAKAVLEESKMHRGTLHGRQLYNNTVGRIFVTKTVGTAGMFGIFVAMFSVIRISLDNQKRRRIVNPMIAGGIMGALVGIKSGLRTGGWSALAGMGLAGSLGAVETLAEVLTGRSLVSRHSGPKEIWEEVDDRLEALKAQEELELRDLEVFISDEKRRYSDKPE
eukprot:TRINITY_DN7196_c0_g1_i1.p1 TRINITY_DN7196_c0_g1~~TRINITY_DN7196_c0_g1_i1.p1  ORF type:complete len:191 (-),score=34.65 TRINITY_DN7196_c0_g1_i1:113-685(-)